MALAVRVFLTLSSSDPDPCEASVFSRLVPVSEEPVVYALPLPPTTQGDMKKLTVSSTTCSGPTEEEHKAGYFHLSCPDQPSNFE